MTIKSSYCLAFRSSRFWIANIPITSWRLTQLLLKHGNGTWRHDGSCSPDELCNYICEDPYVPRSVKGYSRRLCRTYRWSYQSLRLAVVSEALARGCQLGNCRWLDRTGVRLNGYP